MRLLVALLPVSIVLNAATFGWVAGLGTALLFALILGADRIDGVVRFCRDARVVREIRRRQRRAARS